MPFHITLQSDHQYVLAGLVAMYFCNAVLGGRVDAARGKYKVPVGQLYATQALYMTSGKFEEDKWKENGEAFNRVQRGHQHLHEYLADSYAVYLVCGLFYPAYAAKFVPLFVLGNLGYAIGYSIKPGYRVFGEMLYFPAIIGWIYGVRLCCSE